MPQLLRANPKDAQALTELTMLSKGYWGYSVAQLQKWASQLTITAYYLKKFNVFKLMEEDELIGYFSWGGRPPVALLDNMFIHPNHLNKGYGRLLMDYFLKQMKAARFEKVRLNADPNAEGFYIKFGFVKKGDFQSTIPGRFLPIMERKI